jgi:hypothetical protein
VYQSLGIFKWKDRGLGIKGGREEEEKKKPEKFFITPKL